MFAILWRAKVEAMAESAQKKMRWRTNAVKLMWYQSKVLMTDEDGSIFYYVFELNSML